MNESHDPHAPRRDRARALVHTFAGNQLDRADAERRSPAQLANLYDHSGGRYLPFKQLQVLLNESGNRLAWVSRDVITKLQRNADALLLGVANGLPHFAVDVTALDDDAEGEGLNAGRFADCRQAAMVLPGVESAMVAQARSQIEWHRRHCHCGSCGEPTHHERGGAVRRCAACGSEQFPRTDPVAIMLVTVDNLCLLGQSQGRLVSTGMYSALAGFVDQGESIEEAVRREVMEEAGIQVGEVRYHSSQPWPFPYSLMIGCHADALSTEIHIDEAEMADVRWFSRDEVQLALANQHPRLKVPGAIAIAHHLIRSWAAGELAT